MIKVKIDGFGRLQQRLRDMKEVDLSDTLTDIAKQIVRDAQSYVPVDTGQLRQSISYDIQGNVVTVSANTKYAMNVELGLGQTAQPYLTPAFNQNRKEVLTLIRNDIKRQIARGKS